MIKTIIVVCLALIVVVYTQSTAGPCTFTASNADTCTVGPCRCAIFTALLIQSTISSQTKYTTIQFNVTNICQLPVYYIQFSMTDAGTNPKTTLVPQTLPSTYTGHYAWTPSVVGPGSATPSRTWLQFVPTGASQDSGSNPPSNSYMMANNAGNNYQWEQFTFTVTGYVPTFPWILQMHMGGDWETQAADFSMCQCANCDAGYSQRTIQSCTLGYYDVAVGGTGVNNPAGYDDTSTTRSSSVFNENEILYSFGFYGNYLALFFSDEHPLMLGLAQVQDNAAGTTTNYGVSPTIFTPTCVEGSTLSFGSTDFNSNNIQSNTDVNGPESQCTPSTSLPCGRPIPPALFYTDITSSPLSRSGDWQFGGAAYLPQRICGLWKNATKVCDSTGACQVNVFPTSYFTTNVNSLNTGWNLGAGAFALPVGFINPSYVGIMPYVRGFGAMAAWDLSLLNLDPSHTYRFQFTCHDGDQTRVGGDVGQACIIASSACPAGFTGPTCKTCDTNPNPGDGSYTWYCFPQTSADGKTITGYTLLKLPSSLLTTAYYANSGGFIPGKTQFDSAGYAITCNCKRISVPCPDNCCGQGTCSDQNGTCVCTNPATSDATTCCPLPVTPAPTESPTFPPTLPNTPPTQWTPTPTPTPTPVTPPCYNNGSFCKANGICVNDSCVCNPGWSGDTCDINVVPILTCSDLKVENCSECLMVAQANGLLGCTWCTNATTADIITQNTEGSCVQDSQCGVTPFYICPIPLAPYIPAPCPDNCLASQGFGQCINGTDPRNRNTTVYTPMGPNDVANGTVSFCLCFTGYTGLNCGTPPAQTTAIAAAALSTGAVVGIIVGIILFLALAGGGGFAVAQAANNAPMTSVANNPLYVGNANAGSNALYQPST